MSFSGILYVCTVVLPAVFSQKSPMNRHQLELKEHYEHLAMVAGFECDHPQPRLLSVDELLSEAQRQGKAYFPEVTVMHRCDRHVGSCDNGLHKCGPTHATIVKMPFKVTYLEDSGDHAKGEWEMEYHSMENHTSCGCLKYEEAPKPTKTSVHYHYVDPSLVPSQNFLPLDPSNKKPSGSGSSYDVPLYQFNSSSSRTPTDESDQEQESSSKEYSQESSSQQNFPQESSSQQNFPQESPFQQNFPQESSSQENFPQESTSQQYYSQPSISDMTVAAEKEVDRPKPQEENNYSCPTCTEGQVFPGYPGYSTSESSTANEVRDPSAPSKVPSYVDSSKESEATTLTEDLIRIAL